MGHQVQLWDKDSTSDDEFIGTWYISAGGTQCITFEWENADYSKGEQDPDVDLRYINIVNRTGLQNYIQVKAVTTDGSDDPATSWRDGQPGDPDRYVAQICRRARTAPCSRRAVSFPRTTGRRRARSAS